jgi:hypothetical protein
MSFEADTVVDVSPGWGTLRVLQNWLLDSTEKWYIRWIGNDARIHY